MLAHTGDGRLKPPEDAGLLNPAHMLQGWAGVACAPRQTQHPVFFCRTLYGAFPGCGRSREYRDYRWRDTQPNRGHGEAPPFLLLLI